MNKKILYVCLFVCVVLISFCGCKKQMGYGILLWQLPEKNLSDGDVVPVYIKSNISKTYVIGTIDSEEKFEVPLWQITEPASKRETEKIAEKYLEYKNQYARVVLDGLPIREESQNISKQVYRLRKDEVIKVLYKGEGAPVMSGSRAMEGDWLKVLTSDGTQGWCFSYNLRLFDIRVAGTQEQNTKTEEIVNDEVLTKLLERTWYPEIYSTMISSHKIDLEKFNKRYIFDLGQKSGTVRINEPDLNVSYPFVGIEKSGKNEYKLIDTPIKILVRKDNFIVVNHTNSKGMPTSYNFVAISEPIDDIIASEKERRQQLYAQLESFATEFSSSNYGQLQFIGENKFTWSGFKQLQPNVIPKSALGRGTISFDFFISNSLALSYDGVLTFHFDNATEEVSFLYKIEDNGLRLEGLDGAIIKNRTITARSSSPVVIFFAAN